MNEDRFALAITVLGEGFRQKITPMTIRAYRLGLRGLAIDAIESAVSRAVTEKKFMPVPCELRELAGEMTPEDRAIKAWAVVTSAMRGHDYYDTVVYDDPVTTATVRHLWHDWMQFTEAAETHDEVWIRKEFQAVYCSFVRSGISQDAAWPLLGFFEKENRLRGQPTKPIVTIACGLPALPSLRYTPSPRAMIPGPASALLEHIGAMPSESKQ